MAGSISRRLADMEARLDTIVPPRLTPRQKLTVDRYVRLLCTGQEIPPLLRAQMKKLPPEPPASIALQRVIDYETPEEENER